MESKLINVSFAVVSASLLGMLAAAMSCGNMTEVERWRMQNGDSHVHAGRICTPSMEIRKDILFVYGGPYVCHKAYEVQSFVEDARRTTMRLYVDPSNY